MRISLGFKEISPYSLNVQKEYFVRRKRLLRWLLGGLAAIGGLGFCPSFDKPAFAQAVSMEVRYYSTEPFLVGAGLECQSCVQVRLLNGAVAPAGGLAVTVTSNDATRLWVAPAVVPTTGGGASTVVTIPAGGSTTTFSVQGLEGVTGLTTVTATAAGALPATSRPISVVTPGYTLVALSSPQAGGGADAVFRVRVGPLRADGTVGGQSVRRGAPGPVGVTVTNSNPSAGQLVTTAGVGASATVLIASTYSETRTTVAAGGVAFRPLAAGGSTTVTAAIAGFTAAAGASQAVTVTAAAPTLSVSLGALTRLGAGLEVAACCVVTASQPAPAGGVAVTLTSSDATRLMVAPAAIPAEGGSGVVVLLIPEGSTSVAFSLQGREGVTGTATVTATATGHTAGTSPAVSVEAPVMTLVNLSASLAAPAPNDDFGVRLGITATSGGTTFGAAQALRQGGAGAVTATVTTSNAAAGILVTAGGSGASQLVSILPGQSDSPATVAAGGVAFDPNNGAGAETTTVAATAPGFGGTTGATQIVIVTGPSLSVDLGTLTRLGAGLEVSACCVVRSNQSALAGGLVVTLTSTDATRLLVAEAPISSAGGSGVLTVVIPEGLTSASFSLQGVEGAAGPAMVTASATGYSAGTSAVVSIEPPVLTLVNLASTMGATAPNDEFGVRVGLPTTAGGTTFGVAQAVRQGRPGAVTATVTSSAAAAGALVTASGNGLSQPVSILSGQSESPATVATGGVAFDPAATSAGETTTVAATISGFGPTTGASQPVTVGTGRVMELVYYMPEPFLLGAGLQCRSCFQVRLRNGDTAPSGGLSVTLTSSDASRVLLAPAAPTAGGSGVLVVTIPAAGTFANFTAQGRENVTGDVTITATATGAQTATSRPIRVVTPAYKIVACTHPTCPLPTPQTGGGPDVLFRSRVGALQADGVTLSSQEVRHGGPGAIPTTLTSSNPVAGELVTVSSVGATASVQILAGMTDSPMLIASGGVAFRPLSVGGSTTISLTIEGFVPAPGSSQQVTVTPATPILSVGLGGLTRLGAGLEVDACCAVTTNQPAPAGGLLVTLSSSDATRLLVGAAPIPAEGGSGVIVLTIPAGSTSVPFGLQGLEGASGSATVTATATGHTGATSAAVTVEAPVLAIVELSANQATTAPNDEFRVRLGLPTVSGGTSFGVAQARRQGAGSVTATVTTSNAAAGSLVTSSGSGTSQTVAVAPGQSESPATVAAGGIAFDPSELAAGETTTVTGTAPGFGATTGASQTVTVTGPTLSVGLGGLTRLGAGLEVDACCAVTTNQPAPAGGLLVTLSSSDATRLLVGAAPIPAEGGSGVIVLTIPAGSTSVPFGLQGLEGASGSATVTATATGHTGATSAAVTVEAPVLAIVELSANQATTAPNDEFRVRLGLPTVSGGTSFGVAQARRQGAGSVTATVTTSNAAAGSLVTSSGSGTSQTVAVAPGQSESPATVAAGGIAFDPSELAAGETTTVTGTAPGFGATTGASQTVTVGTALTMEIRYYSPEPFRLGAGLECQGCVEVRLLNGAVAPAGGLAVTITSDHPGLLVAPSFWSRTASNSVVITISEGMSTSSSFGIQGLEEARALGRLTATAPGFQPATSRTIQVVESVVAIRNLITAHSAAGPDSFFQIFLGVRAEGGGPLVSAQPTRVSSGLSRSITVTVTSSNGAVGQVATLENRGPTVSFEMLRGHAWTPLGPSDGGERGISFDPLAQGTTDISVSIPGFVGSTEATRTVTVDP